MPYVADTEDKNTIKLNKWLEFFKNNFSSMLKNIYKWFFATLFWVFCHFMNRDFMLYFAGPAFHPLTVAEKMHYLALISDKWSEVEPPFFGSITENLWRRIFSGSRVFWWLLAVCDLQKSPRRHSKMSAFSFINICPLKLLCWKKSFM